MKDSTSLLDGIFPIVPISAKKKMLRVHAGRSIAIVKYAFIFRNWTKMESPRNLMCFQRPISFSRSSKQEPVRSVCCAYPEPTVLSLKDVLPKSLRHRSNRAGPTTKNRPALQSIRPTVELFFTERILADCTNHTLILSEKCQLRISQ